ncbi:properdin-like isoform X8 [Syngnathoides biaculeatus]|uniref:properdin-like isoform X8 n=1 Tax=Syngnathoides biaculeatus TaxID=300417 RepID=UPI002ADE0FF5|nr:properdin-like isoform X8 [Syngnathoides biaculeatus]
MKKVKRMLDIFVFSVVLGAEFAHAVTCFARLERSTGTCREELGDLDEDDCCLNTRYAYRTPDGDCQSCGPPTWSDWSPWSPCSTLCGEGVTQRSRKCFGFGQLECKNAADALQTKPCDGACCDEGWSSWLAWSPCSVTCGGGGVRTQERLCHAPPECLSACVGVSRMELRCDAPAGCPAILRYRAALTQCTAGGRRGRRGLRVRRRARTTTRCRRPDGVVAPAPRPPLLPTRCRPGTVATGMTCRYRTAATSQNVQVGRRAGFWVPSRDVDFQGPVSSAVDGQWGEWSPPGICSARCGQGLQLASRKCDRPPPKHGGRFCEGPSARSSVCYVTCAGACSCSRSRLRVLTFTSTSRHVTCGRQLMDPGPAGPIGANVLLPVSRKAELPSGLASASALAPPLPSTPEVRVAVATTAPRRPAPIFRIAPSTARGGPGRPSRRVPSPAASDWRCPAGAATAPPPSAAAARAPATSAGLACATLTSTVRVRPPPVPSVTPNGKVATPLAKSKNCQD